MVKYNGKYVITGEYVSEGNIHWIPTGNGEFVIGTYEGVPYFIKRNMNVRKPTRDLPKDVYNLLNEAALWIENKQKMIKKQLHGLSAMHDHIVIEEDHFWDADQRFVTVTRKIDHALASSFKFETLALTPFIDLIQKMAQCLDIIHQRGVIHGDLKEGNFIFSTAKSGITPFLIDFDSSYLIKDVPAWDKTTFSNGYQSPEIAVYTYDLDASSKSTITPATDIFTLGIIIHKLWTKNFPLIESSKISCGEALAMGESLSLDKKFNVAIGKKHEATLISLLNWMLQADYQKRPTAKEIVLVCSDQMMVPEVYHVGNDKKPFDTLWDTHIKIAELYPVDNLKAKGVISLKKINDGGFYKYEVTQRDKTLSYTIDELCIANFANRFNADIDDPWEDHQIAFIDPNDIARLGYVSIKRHISLSQQRYLVKMSSGIAFDKGLQWLISSGLATYQITESAAIDTPWPEHGTSYAEQLFLDRNQIKEIKRYDDIGEHRYTIIYRDGTKNQSVSYKNMLMMGLIKR